MAAGQRRRDASDASLPNLLKDKEFMSDMYPGFTVWYVLYCIVPAVTVKLIPGAYGAYAPSEAPP